MMVKHHTILPYTALILCRGEEILLIKNRKCGLYTCAGGKFDGDEPATQALIREAREELGICLHQEDLKIVHIVHARQGGGDVETIGIFIEASAWEGELCNMEPEKHEDIAWFNRNALPQNTRPSLVHVLAILERGYFYSEFGWKIFGDDSTVL